MISEKNVFFSEDAIKNLIATHLYSNKQHVNYKKFVADIINCTTVVNDISLNEKSQSYLEESTFFENHK